MAMKTGSKSQLLYTHCIPCIVCIMLDFPSRLARENPVSDWLTEAGISPSDTQRWESFKVSFQAGWWDENYDFRQPLEGVWQAVLAGAGTRPHIDCEKIDGQVYIKEVSPKQIGSTVKLVITAINQVKVCYNKNLARVDCDGIKGHGTSRQVEKQKMMGTCTR